MAMGSTCAIRRSAAASQQRRSPCCDGNSTRRSDGLHQVEAMPAEVQRYKHNVNIVHLPDDATICLRRVSRSCCYTPPFDGELPRSCPPTMLFMPPYSATPLSPMNVSVLSSGDARHRVLHDPDVRTDLIPYSLHAAS